MSCHWLIPWGHSRGDGRRGSSGPPTWLLGGIGVQPRCHPQGEKRRFQLVSPDRLPKLIEAFLGVNSEEAALFPESARC